MATLTRRTVYAAEMRSMLACDSNGVTVTLWTIEGPMLTDFSRATLY